MNAPLQAYDNSTGWKNRLKLKMIREGLEPGLLDDPDRILCEHTAIYHMYPHYYLTALQYSAFDYFV